MSTLPELGGLPPSPEVQREMALAQIRFFQSVNQDYRQLVTLIHRFPTSKRMTRLQEICGTIKDSSDPMVETSFFKDIDPNLVETSVNALVDEIVKNRELAASLANDTDEADKFDAEFRDGLIERVLTDDTTAEDDEAEPLYATNPLEELSTGSLIKFMGGIHECTVTDIYESLEESESVSIGLEQEYQRQERIRTTVIGLVAFAGALGGSLVADRIKRK